MQRLVVLCVLLCAFADAASQNWTGYASLTTDYVRRGVSQSDGHGAVQLGGDVAFDTGAYGGLWASTIDIDSGSGRRRDTEVNLYAGFGRDISSTLHLSAYAVAYFFPGQTGNVDYNYIEYSVSANISDRLWLEYSYSPDLYDTGLSTNNIEAIAEVPLPDDFTMSAGVGRYDTSGLTGKVYTYWQIGITRRFRRVDLDLRYHDTDRDVLTISTPDSANARLALSVTIPF